MSLDLTDDQSTLVPVMAWCHQTTSHNLSHMTSQGHNELTLLPLDKMASILANHIFTWIFLNENDRIQIQISLRFVPRSPLDSKPAVIQVMARHRTGDKPLSEPMMTQFTDAYIYAALWEEESTNPLWPSDAIWQQWSGSTFAQIMVCGLMTLRAITWTKVDYSSVRSCGIHLRAISLEMFKIHVSILDVSLWMPNLRLPLHIPGISELICAWTHCGLVTPYVIIDLHNYFRQELIA